MLKTIDHLNLVVRDLGRASDFFVDPGFKEEDRAELPGEWISEIVGLEEVRAKYVKLVNFRGRRVFRWSRRSIRTEKFESVVRLVRLTG